MHDLKVINFFAEPAAGKSTAAAGLYNLMKQMGMSVELVSEYAKDLTYEKSYSLLDNQLLILAQQEHRLRRLVGNVEYAITDSPLPLGLAYLSKERDGWMVPTVWAAFDQYKNFNVLMKRPDGRAYDPKGRNQTADEAGELKLTVEALFMEAIEDFPEHPALVLEADFMAPYMVHAKALEFYNGV